MADLESNRSIGDKVLALIQAKHPNYHPLLAIADLAHDTDDDRLKFDCHKAIAKYVQPELKSVEVKASVSEHRRVIVSLFDGDSSDSSGIRTIDVTDVQAIAPPSVLVEHDPMWDILESVTEAVAA